MKFLKKECEKVLLWPGPRLSGKTTQLIGMLITSSSLDACLGEICYIYGKKGKRIPCQVVGFKEERALLMPLSEMTHIAAGCEVFPTGEIHQVAVSQKLAGRILDALGNPIDGKGPIEIEKYYPVAAGPPSPLQRKRITKVLATGIRAIDGFITLGRGQRMGIFSPAGVGKSTLMAQLAKRSDADINVIALIGERGREVKEFIERDLGREGLARSVIIVSTSDQMATLRSKGANVATAIAEFFRDSGKHVLLMMDSLTRYCLSLREIGLNIGEPAAIRGYPPSLFSYLPTLLERAGNSEKGSITGIYTILEDQEENDPIADYLRSLLDGHIILSKKLSLAHRFPPIDVLKSLSRSMSDIVSKEHLHMASTVRDLLQAYKETEELIEVGAYVKGTNAKVDKALEKMEKITHFLQQKAVSCVSFEKMLQDLSSLL